MRTGWMMAVAMATLTACGGGKEKIADRVEDNADNRAEAMREASESMTNALQQNGVEQQADTVREAGQERADAIRESELRAERLTNQEKNKLIRGE